MQAGDLAVFLVVFDIKEIQDGSKDSLISADLSLGNNREPENQTETIPLELSVVMQTMYQLSVAFWQAPFKPIIVSTKLTSAWNFLFQFFPENNTLLDDLHCLPFQRNYNVRDSISGLPKVTLLAIAEAEGEGGKTSAIKVEAEGEAKGLVFCI